MRALRTTAAVLAIALGIATGSVAGASRPSRLVDDVKISPADFSNPTQITNRIAPVSQLSSVISLGVDTGAPTRIEVTVLPDTKTIRWQGGSTEVVVAQFLGITDGRVVEVAYDWLAQDDAGNLWYFGEDVTNYKRGKVTNHEGSWLAGADGPPGMLMPADPQVGDVFRPENIPGLVFEKDRVLSTTKTIDGPRGPIEGVVKVREVLMDGTSEFKFWVPGYGEFRALVPGEEDVSTVFALPIDAQADPAPSSLTDLRRRAADAHELAVAGDLAALAESVTSMQADWAAYDPQSRPVIPDEFVTTVDDALSALSDAVESEDVEAAQQAAIEVELATLVVITTHGEPQDALRIDALSRRRDIEAARKDRPAAASTAALISALSART